MPGRKVYVVGVGMTRFVKPGTGDDYPEMAKEAIENALADSGVSYDQVQYATAGYCYGDSTCGQRALYTVGMSGIPLVNVNNNCSTGSTALMLAKQLIEGGIVDCALAFGFEKMERGSLGSKFQDRTNPLDKHMSAMMKKRGFAAKSPPLPQLFGNAGVEHMEKYGTKPVHFAKIGEKNHRHSRLNPYSQFRDVYTLEQVMNARKVFGPLTKLQCCPTSDGAGAAIVCSEDFVVRNGLQATAVEIAGQAMATDMESSLQGSDMRLVGYDMSRKAATEALAQAGVSIGQVKVVELHDCFSANELVTYEAIGLCPEGGAAAFIDSGDNTYGGRVVVNPSGGLISKGHPLGATGLAQCSELCWQLRGECGERQVPNADVALQHNLGLGGAAVVTVFKKAQFAQMPPRKGKPLATALKPREKAGGAGVTLRADAVFQQMGGALQSEALAGVCEQVGAVFGFEITKGDAKKKFIVDLKTGPKGTVKEAAGNADCWIIIGDDDFVQLIGGKLNPMAAFSQGKLKLKGNMMLAQKLQVLVKAMKQTKPAAAAPSGMAADRVFAELKKRLTPAVVAKVGCTFLFEISKGDAKKSFLVDLKSGSGSITEGAAGASADCTVIINDDDFAKLMAGKLNPMAAFSQGKLKLKGNMMLAQKLQALIAPASSL